jgi:hypothetical protein
MSESVLVNMNPSGSMVHEIKIFQRPTLFLHFCDYLPLGRGRNAFKQKQFWIPVTQGWFLPSFIEIGLLVLEKIFFLILSVFLLFCYYLPLNMSVPIHLNIF